MYRLTDHPLSLSEVEDETSLDEADKNEAAKFLFANYIYKQYRCFAVHEARTQQDPFGDDDEPFYLGSSDKGNYKLFVPRVYIYKTFDNVIKSYKEYCLANKFDPLSRIVEDVTDTTFY